MGDWMTDKGIGADTTCQYIDLDASSMLLVIVVLLVVVLVYVLLVVTVINPGGHWHW